MKTFYYLVAFMALTMNGLVAQEQSSALIRTIKPNEGHTGWISSIAYSPNGKTITSGSVDATLKLWNTETGTLLKNLKGHTGTIVSVAYSPDGKTLASGGEWQDKTVKLWNAETGELLRTKKEYHSSIHSVAYSPDGKTIASGSDDGTIKLWRTSLISLPASLAFAETKVGKTVVKDLTIKNTADFDVLTVTKITLPAGFTADWQSDEIAVGSEKTVKVSFKPTEVKAYAGTITVESNLSSYLGDVLHAVGVRQ